ncbi:MAG: cysteine hydrolase [Nitrososphaeria archaeon]|nr:cysteine hydrolase [Aigarchaeota archaeon]MCX8187890.1 cysteine hydrolase [Nitrososphaeria archaeon]MDW8021256.1 isochorismatase family cysteine hydrolase [Nitrososphaerota archaeon]
MSKYAVIVIDMLNDFVYGALKCERAHLIIPNMKKLLAAARDRGIPVIYANDAHDKRIDHEFKLWGQHAVKGSDGSRVIEELEPAESDYVVEKKRYSAFYETGLDMLLRELEVDTVVLTGLHTNICVKHTAADAFYRGYNIIILSDAVQTFTDEDHNWGLKYAERIYGAKIMTTEEFLNMISYTR